MSIKDEVHLKEIYAQTLAKYGDSAEAVQWSQETQMNRFKILSEIGDINNSSLLDFGCGMGHLASYLKDQGLSVNYTGVDILPDFLAIAREKNPQSRFGLLSDFTGEKFDYVFISGVFNNRLDNNVEYYQKYLKILFQMTKKGLSFNMLSTYANYYDEPLFYENPEKIFHFVKTELSPFVTIRNDYQLRKDAFPVDFCVYVYRK